MKIFFRLLTLIAFALGFAVLVHAQTNPAPKFSARVKLTVAGVSGLLIHNLSVAQSSAAASTQPLCRSVHLILALGEPTC